MAAESKEEQEATKALEQMGKDLESLAKKDKADLDKAKKLMKDIEKEAKKMK